eukprot:scaffold99089_cov18-Tisochrysis_lutea.AAC.1
MSRCDPPKHNFVHVPPPSPALHQSSTTGSSCSSLCLAPCKSTADMDAVRAWFMAIDLDRSGELNSGELQRALSMGQ